MKRPPIAVFFLAHDGAKQPLVSQHSFFKIPTVRDRAQFDQPGIMVSLHTGPIRSLGLHWRQHEAASNSHCNLIL
ncbi:hypothetical protein [Aestuariivivens sediminicola]|uniref:hypothetical protein n=1 Tax=Aestuariivivens sediminicola TaxID=2913560 RepID=UPI001F56F20C|nr:hypothetical protein [Aestuariivivens sediminicola]